MKRLFLGSLLSCLVVGQVSFASEGFVKGAVLAAGVVGSGALVGHYGISKNSGAVCGALAFTTVALCAGGVVYRRANNEAARLNRIAQERGHILADGGQNPLARELRILVQPGSFFHPRRGVILEDFEAGVGMEVMPAAECNTEYRNWGYGLMAGGLFTTLLVSLGRNYIGS